MSKPSAPTNARKAKLAAALKQNMARRKGASKGKKTPAAGANMGAIPTKAER